MENKLQLLIEKIKKLEKELAEEIQNQEEMFFYKIRGGKVLFEKNVKKKHKAIVKTVSRYLSDAKPLNILTAPVIWFCIFPALFMDLVVTFYQAICFRVYGMPRVKRNKYIVIDRRSLSYLNGIEKLNCAYCGYFNGLIAYVQEVAARTEQYWCPIKHARRTALIHSRYGKFFEYGDGDGYRNKIEEVRRDFDDIKEGNSGNSLVNS
ncbi:MAG: hypothetical protein U9N47_06550 [Thermodesulfobacteriota bacterium]|nr:hypothetical protein [Thermodesulfobacteriota bacterium]